MSLAAPTTISHTPVLLEEAVAGLNPEPGGRYLDGTFGGGGHTKALLDANEPGGIVLALDLDPEAFNRARGLAAHPRYANRLIAEQASFVELLEVAKEHSMLPLDGILLDLGMSTFQLESPDRGFSFSSDGPLDMRFDPGRGAPAHELVNTLDERQLADIIWRIGEDRKSRRIARGIVEARQPRPIETPAELAAIVESAVGGRRGARVHPATRTFQALRIAVNDELTALATVLPLAVESLAQGGRLAVIAFHSLENRIVKQFMRRESSTCICPPGQPECTCGHVPTLKPIGKAIRPSAIELEANPRSRSAILRIAERTAAERTS